MNILIIFTRQCGCYLTSKGGLLNTLFFTHKYVFISYQKQFKLINFITFDNIQSTHISILLNYHYFTFQYILNSII